MKGWRPSACPWARNRFGLFCGRILPDIGSIGLSLSPVLGLMVHGPGFLFALIGPAAGRSDGNGAHASAITKRRQLFTCRTIGGTRSQHERERHASRSQQAAPTLLSHA
jgi:hypothetical protein